MGIYMATGNQSTFIFRPSLIFASYSGKLQVSNEIRCYRLQFSIDILVNLKLIN